MIHTMLRKSVGLSVLVFFGIGYCFYAQPEEGWLSSLKVGAASLVVIVCLMILAIVSKVISLIIAKKRGKIIAFSGDDFGSSVLEAIDNAAAVLAFLLLGKISLDMGDPFRQVFPLYLFVSGVYVFFSSKGDLSSLKLLIVSVLVTPIVAYLLIKYNNTQSKKEAEKYIEWTKSSIERGEFDEAIHYASEGVEICPKVNDAEYQLARCYYWRGKAYSLTDGRDKAIEDYLKALTFENAGDSFLVSVREELEKLCS